MFITAVCVLFFIKLRWPNNKSLYKCFYFCLIFFLHFLDTHDFYLHPHPRLPPTTHDPRQLVILDIVPQFSSDKFKAFSHKWQFEHTTSSPGYPQSNGKAEQAVKEAKKLMKKTKKAGTDPYLALLAQRKTPTQGLDSSPQRLMSRRTKTPWSVHLD